LLPTIAQYQQEFYNMDRQLAQRNILSLTVNELVNRLPPLVRQTIPSHLLTKPSLFLAQRLQSMGGQQEATTVLHLLVQAEPVNTEALYRLGLAYNRIGNRVEASKYIRRHYEQRMRANGMDPLFNVDTLQYLLSTEGFAAPPVQVPQAYVENLFDRFSDHFDERLLNQLTYKAPKLLCEVFCNVAKGEKAYEGCKELVDLGCGTGLAGKYFQAICATLTGVDISSEMIEKARLRGIYDELIVNEIMAYLGSVALPIDIFIATDVFNYFGEMEPILAACRNRQGVGGLLAFSVETLETTSANEQVGFKLASSGRFQHERHYVLTSAVNAGYQLMTCAERVLRHEDGLDVQGYLFVLKAA
jgi:predicted TPR repeat methyltransferase